MGFEFYADGIVEIGGVAFVRVDVDLEEGHVSGLVDASGPVTPGAVGRDQGDERNHAGVGEQPPVGFFKVVVPVLSTLIRYLNVVTASPFMTPAPPNARGSVRALTTSRVSVLVCWRRGAVATIWFGAACSGITMAGTCTKTKAKAVKTRQPLRSRRH